MYFKLTLILLFSSLLTWVAVESQACFASDATLFSPRQPWNLQRINDPTNPIIEVERSEGTTGRVEYLYAEVRPRHLNRGTRTSPASRTYAQSLGKSTDDAGHIIAQRLGGSGTAQFNLFPQSKNINRGVWAQQEATVAQSLGTAGPNGVARMTFRFNYPTTGLTNRPTCFTYRIVYPDGKQVVYNVVNP